MKASTAKIGARIHGHQQLHGSGRHEIAERVAHPRRGGEAERCAGAGEEKALGEHLTGEAHAAGAEREARGEFLFAHRGPREHEVGHVGADDEQHQNADAHENAQRPGKQALRAMRRIRQGQQRGAHAFADIGIGDGHAVGKRFELTARLLDGDARLEARDAEHVAVVAVAQHPFLHAVERGLLHVGNPEIEGGDGHRTVEGGRGNADNGQLMLVDGSGSADDGWVGAEVGAPVAIADDGDGELAGSIGEFSGQEEAASFWLDPEHSEEVAGDQFAPDAIGMIFPADAECRRGA